MQKYFNTFPDTLSFDITYKVCNSCTEVAEIEGDKPTLKYWNIGVFSVPIEDNRPVIVGLCFILNETKKAFLQLF